MEAGVRRPIALVILDGWGLRPECDHNAVCLAQTPRLDALFQSYNSTRLGASGGSVGLPDGQMGNSEVGHLNLGAGRIVYQDLTRITKSIADGDFFTNPVLLAVLKKIRATKGKLHLLGLLSDGGVHSHNSHLYALVELAKQQGIEEICIHPFLDGRDTPPKSGAGYLKELEDELKSIGRGRVATVTGRFYAMDRDNRWDRVERAYKALVGGEGKSAASSSEAIDASYADGITDEFVEPWVIADGHNNRIADGDAVIFFNFRADRAREITRALTFAEFDGFGRASIPQLADYVCLTEYDESFGLPVAYQAEGLPDLLGEVVAGHGKTQLRIAETEKYAHVTFFFNGGNETPFTGEDRVLVPSPKEVATYDLKPAMSAEAVADETVARVESGNYDLIIVNFANPDMVGHTGVLPAAITAMETVDCCVGKVVDAVVNAGGSLLITADHGNCEQMQDAKGGPHTAHTTNPVPLIYVDPTSTDGPLREGILADIAPTLLSLLGIEIPESMTGESLLKA
ncbi:MAG: 2,3-bisphosphoglycerate-independent phosphoglycerate mutase [Desulfuromonas sp.]|nr:MAG: 2,3-bisphosphoglycerate-independent phosphoglycerate mutase [Desulfuromonas sp.]